MRKDQIKDGILIKCAAKECGCDPDEVVQVIIKECPRKTLGCLEAHHEGNSFYFAFKPVQGCWCHRMDDCNPDIWRWEGSVSARDITLVKE